jgi:DDE family transposase
LLRGDRVHGPHVYPVAAAARELGCGSPSTCWRRLTEWAAAGVFEQLHLAALERLGGLGQLDWSRVSVDTMSVRARRGGTMWAQIPWIVAPGSRLHLVCDGSGLPLTAAVTAANVADVTMLAALVDDIPPVRTPSGRRRVRPDKSHADKGYDSRPTALGCDGGGSGPDRAAWDRVVGPARAPPLAGGAVAVVGELLQAAAGAVGPGFGAVVRVRAGGLCGGVL